MAVTAQAVGTKTPPIGTVTITNASPAVVSYTAHGLAAGDAVVFASTGALPTGLTAGTTYYVIAAGLVTNAFEVSATVGGAAINTSSAGSGTFSMYSEVVLTDVAVAGTFVGEVDLSAMAAGDSVILNVYKIILTGGARQPLFQSPVYNDAQAPTIPTPFAIAGAIVVSVPCSNELTDAGSIRFTICVLAGTTPKAYPWKVLKFA